MMNEDWKMMNDEEWGMMMTEEWWWLLIDAADADEDYDADADAVVDADAADAAIVQPVQQCAHQWKPKSILSCFLVGYWWV